MANLIGRSIKLRLAEHNAREGNAFFLMAAFKARAQLEGWSVKEIMLVLNECMRGNYEHLRKTLADHCDQEAPDAMDSGIYNPPDDPPRSRP